MDKSVDTSDMYSAISDFPRHISEGVSIGQESPSIPKSRARNVVILGMGGSAIGGDLLRSFVGSFASCDVGVQVVRGYVPPHTNRSTLVVASSYSGNTEETLTSLDAAAPGAGAVLACTTGGQLGKIASKRGYRTITVPGGLQPRAALAYSFFPLLYCLAVKNALFGEEVKLAAEEGIAETTSLITSLARKYGNIESSTNKAIKLAERINGRVPVVYSSSHRFDTVNLRWRGQFQENAKYLAFGNLLPEMNHNEINGWTHPEEMVGNFIAIFLRDREDHPRVAARMDISRKIVGRSAGDVVDVKSQGETLLARMFSLVHLADWTSYYLALVNGVDPTPVPLIEGLKKQLARV